MSFLPETLLGEFNFYEAVFWLILAVALLLVATRFSRPYRTWALFTAANLFLFGVTDIVELYTDGFLHTATWLLWWKAVHVGGLLASLIWYGILRFK